MAPAAGAAVLLVLLAGAAFALRRWMIGYVERREEIYQPAILMAIANEAFRTLGPPFSETRRAGDWTIVESALLKYSAGLRGFSHKAFCDIFAQNGFGDHEKLQLSSPFPWVRARAAQRLGQMLYAGALPELLRAMNDSSLRVREAASWALARMAHESGSEAASPTALPSEAVDPDSENEGSVSGRFFWEDRKPVVISQKEEDAWLMHEIGGMSAGVRNIPSKGPDGKPAEERVRGAYRSNYSLPWLDPGRPATIIATLKQPVADYYAVSERKRANIVYKPGYETRSVDFVFPRYKNQDDRVSLVGRLDFPDRPPPGYPRENFPKTVVSVGEEEGEFFSGYLSYHALRTYRIHDVPPGTYRIFAVHGAFRCEGTVSIPQTQPATVDLKLAASLRR